MSREPLTDSGATGDAAHRHNLYAEKPLIKVLLYTDDPDDITQDTERVLGLGLMKEHLEAHGPAFARLCVTWASRNSDNSHHADNKIDKLLRDEHEKTGSTFDQIWFFGLHQANKENFSLSVFRGGPESELDENEVRVLQDWMLIGNNDMSVGGGVLIAGDHNHPRPADAVAGTNRLCPDDSIRESHLGRGRALGRCVPRAGQLRKWEGAPTNSAEDSFNTIANSGLQTDRIPQPLILRNLDAAGDPDPNGQPHPIFSYKPGEWIRVFPDHVHEGTVVVPKNFDGAVWPGETRPHVVAYGIDRRFSKLLDLVATYNGDRGGVGRIVADGSWHHYFNVNLLGFPHPAPQGSAADQIGQFYGNLAVWLAPLSKRRQMAWAMCWQLANYTMLMEMPGDLPNIGKESYSILSRVASPCEIHEMIRAMTPERFGALYFPEPSLALSHLPSQELLLACVLNSYHEKMKRAELSSDPREAPGIDQVISSGFEEAFKEQAKRLALKAWETLNLIGL